MMIQNLHYVSKHLEASYKTVTHSSGEQALKYLNHHRVDIAVEIL